MIEKDIANLERILLISAKHIVHLKHSRERKLQPWLNRLVLSFVDSVQQQPKTQQLSVIEQIGETFVPMFPNLIRIISFRNALIRDWQSFCQTPVIRFCTTEIVCIDLLRPLISVGLAMWANIFNGNNIG